MKMNPLQSVWFAGVLALTLSPAASRAFTTNTSAAYVEVDLVSDLASNAPVTDPRLVNPWGLVTGPGVVWVNDNGTGLTTVYGDFGYPFPFAINVPGPGN